MCPIVLHGGLPWTGGRIPLAPGTSRFHLKPSSRRYQTVRLTHTNKSSYEGIFQSFSISEPIHRISAQISIQFYLRGGGEGAGPPPSIAREITH